MANKEKIENISETANNSAKQTEIWAAQVSSAFFWVQAVRLSHNS